MKIEILGSGCPKCFETERRVQKVVQELGLQAEVVHVYDLMEIARRRVVLTPAVAIDGEVKISGHVPTEDELRAILSPR
jgi:small redox-active disulfide protein 2